MQLIIDVTNMVSIQINTFILLENDVFITQVRLHNQLTVDDNTWHSRSITHLDISLSMHDNFYWAFQQPVCLFYKRSCLPVAGY